MENFGIFLVTMQWYIMLSIFYLNQKYLDENIVKLTQTL